MNKTPWDRLLPIAVLIIGFVCIPLTQLSGLEKMPGDIGDARLNNYFLENVYQFLTGRSPSLWHLPFFFPFPYILGFSDNLFGTAPVYLAARLLTGEPDTSFQLWFYVGYIANYAAAWWALRRLGGSTLGTCLGAFIFAFALPTTTHVGHTQLHYRFGIPLSAVFFVEFLSKGSLWGLFWAGFWLTWQFFAGIYMGFFALLLLASMFLVDAICLAAGLTRRPGTRVTYGPWEAWKSASVRERQFTLLGLGLLVLALIWLFVPYLMVTRLYGAKRSWEEIASMLPRPASYLMATSSLIWSGLAESLPVMPMKTEHQMFVGLLPLCLAIYGAVFAARKNATRATLLIASTALIPCFASMTVSGFSLWYYLRNVPLISAIRVMTRLDQALLFPLSYFSMLAIERLLSAPKKTLNYIAALFCALTVVESSAVRYSHISTKQDWRTRLEALEKTIPEPLPSNAVLFFAQKNAPLNVADIDAMLVAQRRGVPTMNGYSGNLPPGHQPLYLTDCVELPLRVMYYMQFVGKEEDESLYLSTIKRVIPIGFENCKPGWFMKLQKEQFLPNPYTAEQFRQLSFNLKEVKHTPNGLQADFTISNMGERKILALDSGPRQVRLTWRFLDGNQIPLTTWDTTRKALPGDIPAEGKLDVALEVTPPAAAHTMEVSMVQENVFWAHDVGLKPLDIPLP